MRGTCVLLMLVAVLAIATPAGADPPPGAYPYVPWTELLPPGASSTAAQPGPEQNCDGPATMACMDGVIERLKNHRDAWGCDHRAVFANTYMLLSEQLKKAIQEPAFFDDDAYLIYEAVAFENYYENMAAANAAGKPIPEAWRIANDVAAKPNSNAAVDMLLGINAHVQRDMPYVVAAEGLRFPDGRTRKPDHDRVNKVLAAAYEPIVEDITARYDPMVSLTNSKWTPIDDVGGLEVVKEWREGVWRNAERLENAKTDSERQQVSASIEANAATWARMIATGQVQPGYGATRDAYCRAHLHQ
jgi:hypothetical protein